MRKNKNIKVMVGLLIMLVALPVTVGATGFTDVGYGKWYYQDIKEIKEKGIISGYGDGTFKPEQSVSRVEALKIIVEGKTQGKLMPEVGRGWYKVYEQYGITKGVSIGGLSGMFQPITRAEVAEYIVKIHEKGLREAQGSLLDSDSLFMERLHRDGIMVGQGMEQGKPVVKPNTHLTRAEMATLANRLLKEKKGSGMVLPGGIMRHKVSEPTTQEQFEAEILDMIEKRELERTISYREVKGGIPFYQDVIGRAFRRMYRTYPEYMAYTNSARIRVQSLGRGQDVVLTLTSQGDRRSNKSTEELLDIFERESAKVIQKLKSEHKLRAGQSEREQALAIYTWIIQNTKYVSTGYEEDYTGYGQITSGQAVCQGYVATYNYLLRLMGIEVEGVSGYANGSGKEEKHIWTEAVLDGKRVIIDATYGDPTPDRGDKVDYKYFDISTRELRKTHRW